MSTTGPDIAAVPRIADLIYRFAIGDWVRRIDPDTRAPHGPILVVCGFNGWADSQYYSSVRVYAARGTTGEPIFSYHARWVQTRPNKDGSIGFEQFYPASLTLSDSTYEFPTHLATIEMLQTPGEDWHTLGLRS